MAMNFYLHVFLIQISITAVTSVIYSCLANSTCGCSLNSAVLTKIIGGEPAEQNTWRWAVSIRIKNSHICGGSLISSTLVLTAAHCLISLKSLSSLSITIGSKYLSIIHQQRFVSNIYIHKDYDSKTFVNDIAILYLSFPINKNDPSIAFICLPFINNTEYLLKPTNVIAIGWGVLSSNSKTVSNTLQQVTLQTLSITSYNCQKSIYNNSLQFCAGIPEGGKDTCQGDSGGPLMLFLNHQWILIGITSYGTGCGLANYPGVYTHVSYYIDWINCFMINNTLCIENNILKQNLFSSIGIRISSKNIFVFFLCILTFDLCTP